ncbi:hypothetical protein ACVIW2_003352 [Bradyrhizobium huanghuaihaiense]|uniref:Uncharacterized protein n=1 Tax=Bradyrhizobium huanghuaihaiense TaxID=990078 RepID=A0A562R4P7_9BRAD|nr:hypothetical protein [Bradyrhizobium huanghuaihaiense]TWI63336.1 hypothetical protein IQ16_06395 [Bradyrhizobium huanghuaihaiense]
MTSKQDAHSKVGAEARDSLGDNDQSKPSRISSQKDSLSDGSLDEVSGGRVPPRNDGG